MWFRSERTASSQVHALGVITSLARGMTREVSVVVGLAFAVAVAWATTAERSGTLASPRWPVFLGDASYSLYLIHFPVMSLTAPLASTWCQALLYGIAASLVVALAYHRLVERWLLKASRPGGFRWRPTGQVAQRARGHRADRLRSLPIGRISSIRSTCHASGASSSAPTLTCPTGGGATRRRYHGRGAGAGRASEDIAILPKQGDQDHGSTGPSVRPSRRSGRLRRRPCASDGP